MSTLRFPAPRKLKAWRTLDYLMCGTPRKPGRQRPFADVPRLRLLFSGLDQGHSGQPIGQRQPEPADDPLFDANKQRSDGSWWHTGFPNWSTF
ncbi:MAG: hypothetical protein AW11_03107 [Candidatus Accumulibacter regalis]|jgi:hypothetical protein|uniref:Uncharacterized protein n=1 Tax=Accumulibacter regalis TaxID=522306 RepID=A0A011NUB0_ACCRE|nr:MAG: hypothetical protein AW11_03107 [Candidatus Accumulibacter regalis]